MGIGNNEGHKMHTNTHTHTHTQTHTERQALMALF